MNDMTRMATYGSLWRRILQTIAVVCGLGMLMCGGGGGTGTQAPIRSAGPAVSEPHYEALSVRWLRATDDGRQSEAGALVRPIAEFRNKPISLLVRRTGGDGDGITGPARFEQRFEVGDERVALAASESNCSQPATCTAKEWLELELRGPGGATRRVDRLLYMKGAERRPIPGYRRYTILVAPDAVSTEEVEQRMERARAELALDDRKAKLRAITTEARGAADDKAVALLSQLDGLDPGGPLGHLVALGFAAQSDLHTDRLAHSSGVSVRREVPRILITTAESENRDSKVNLSLDLRLDEVAASSDAGPAAAHLFQMSRGMQESMLEGLYFKQIVGNGGVVSTAHLMAKARKSRVETALYGQRNRAELASLRLPTAFAALVSNAIDRGHEVVLPRAAIDLAGARRWGFWDIDPATGITVGVMEGGQHQVMVEIPTMNKEVPLNPKMGFFLGMHAGMIQSWFGFSALMLKYGEVTPRLIQELKNMLKDSACSACPEANLSAGAAIKLGDDCYKIEIKKLDLLKFDFCEKYGEGFKCALGMMIASLQGDDQLPVRPGAEIKLKIGCTEVSANAGGD